jgi:hypothetical protein
MQRLDLRATGLRQIPEWIWSSTDLEWLNLSENAIESVAERIGELSHLRMLDLGHNEISTLPEAIGELGALSDYLYLSFNHLRRLPASIGRLSNLKYLNVTDNGLAALPVELSELRALRELRLTATPWCCCPSRSAWRPGALPNCTSASTARRCCPRHWRLRRCAAPDPQLPRSRGARRDRRLSSLGFRSPQQQRPCAPQRRSPTQARLKTTRAGIP